MMQQCRIQSQRGFTIIEIMVAVTLSLILLYGVIEVFLGSRTSYQLQSGVARAQENARFALDMMARSISMAGADDTGIGAANGFNSANTLDNASPDATFGFTVTNGKASDTISVVYQSNTDCLGNATAGTATDSYSIARDPVSNISNLYCNGQPMVEGIENMQILYGEDLGPTRDGMADVYEPASSVGNWQAIASVRISILADTIDSAGITNNFTYHLLNAPPIGPMNDNLARRIYTRTILIRNYNADLL